MKCENCSVDLNHSDWPFLFRNIGNLCKACKRKANYLLSNGSKIINKSQDVYSKEQSNDN